MFIAYDERQKEYNHNKKGEDGRLENGGKNKI